MRARRGRAEGRTEETNLLRPARYELGRRRLVSGGSGSGRADCGRAFCFDVVSEAKAGAAADSVRAERGTSAGRTESARAQDEADRPVNQWERSDKKTPLMLSGTTTDGSNLLSGTTQEDRRADYWRLPSGAELNGFSSQWIRWLFFSSSTFPSRASADTGLSA